MGWDFTKDTDMIESAHGIICNAPSGSPEWVDASEAWIKAYQEWVKRTQ